MASLAPGDLQLTKYHGFEHGTRVVLFFGHVLFILCHCFGLSCCMNMLFSAMVFSKCPCIIKLCCD